MILRKIVLTCVVVVFSLVCFMSAQENGEDGAVVSEELLLDDILFGELLDEEDAQPEGGAVESSATETTATEEAAEDDGLLDLDDFSFFEEEEPADAGAGSPPAATADEPETAEEDMLSLDDLFADEDVATETAEDAVAVEEEAAPAAEEDAGDDMLSLDDLFADDAAEETVEPEPEVTAAREDEAEDDLLSMDDLFADEATEAEPAEEAVPAADDGMDDLDLLMDEAIADAEEEGVSEPPAMDDDLDALLGMEAEEPAQAAPAAGSTEDDMDDLLGFLDEEPEAEEAVAAQPARAPAAQRTEPEETLTARQPPAREAAPAPQPQRTQQAAARPAAPPADPRAVLFGETEALRRQALQKHAEETVQRAAVYLKDGQYQDAVRLFEQALTGFIQAGDIPGNEERRNQTRRGLAEAYYRWGILLRKQNDLEAAEQMARNAAVHFHPKAGTLLGQIEQDRESPPPPPKVRVPSRWENEELKNKEKLIAERMKLGRQYFMTGELDQAKALFEFVLRNDPYNVEAIRMLHRVSQRKLDLASKEFETTRTTMMAELRKAWNPRDYAISEGAGELLRGLGPSTQQEEAVEESDRIKVLNKMESIIIPEVDFRQANIQDVIAFLQDASVEFDKKAKEGEARGVNIILNLQSKTQTEAPQETAADPFADAFAQPDAAQPGSDVPLITFTARQISLYESLKIVTEVANLKHRIEGSVVMIVPFDAPEGAIIHRMYDVLPTVIERIREIGAAQQQPQQRGGGFIAMEGGPGAGERVDLKAFFSEMGVTWPAGASIKFLPAIGKLVVANTSENLTVFEKILSVLNVVPNQIEIESRFVEVNQTDLDSLGFEWLLTDNWEVAQKKGQGNLPLSARQRIEVPATSFSKGNRFMRSGIGVAGAGVADDVISFASVLTNPQLKMVLHMLEQQGNTDLLSAPKVTTQSGTEATIKVVTEYIYPTDFNVTPITGTDANGNSVVVGGVVEPSGFQTREVGVILQVLPEVSAEGLINLTMSPEVVSEPVWKNYGSVYTAPDGSQQQLTMEQPFFHTRTISTSISIYNDATVVMGGMINEIRTAVDDRIPFLGELPLVGRLFRSKYEQSEKRNLLIFVTARLVDPAGRALQPQRQQDLIVSAE